MLKLISRLLLALVALGHLPAFSDGYPSKPITIVVPYPPGGLTDQLAREIGNVMSTTLHQPVIVDNKPGGVSQIAVNVVKQAPADGYTVLMGDLPSLSLNVNLMSKLSYDPKRDLQAVARLVVSPGFLVVPDNSPYKTFPELVAAAKSGRQFNYASQGVGSGAHLFGTLLSRQLGVPLHHVPYKGSIAGLTDVMSGQVDLMYDTVPSAGPLVLAGKLRVLAVGHDERLRQFPSVPTLKELGYADTVPTFWWGVAVKAGTPQDVVSKLEFATKQALQDPRVSKKFTDQGVVISTTESPKEFSDYIAAETRHWGRVIKESGMTLD